MKVEVYYREKNEDFKKTFSMIREVIAEFKKEFSFKLLEIQLIQVNGGSEEENRFFGHITVKLNGEDLEERSKGPYTTDNREYSIGDEKVLHVPREVFVNAVKDYIESSITAQQMKGDDSPQQIC